MRKFSLFLLALVWAGLVYGLHQSIGYEKSTGYPSIIKSMCFAFMAALPMFLGPFVADNREESKLNRSLCVAWLAAEVFFLLAFSWLKLLALPPLLGLCLLLCPKINTPQLHWRQWLLNATLTLVGLSLFVWWQYFHFPLPSDAEMTAHFNVHRAEFGQLVKGYRDFRRYLPTEEDYKEEKRINDLEAKLKRGKKLTDEASRAIDEARNQALKKFGPDYEMLPDVKALKANLGVYHIIGAGRGGNWYPNHYSTKTIQTVKRYENHWFSLKDHLYGEDSFDFIRRELPSLFEGTTPVRDFRYVSQLTEVIELQKGTPKQPADVRRWRYGTSLRKSYYHFPQPPRIENGHVLVHIFQASGAVDLAPSLRVLDSLDAYPPDWQAGECVLKRIDEQWFIALCRSY